MSNVQDPLERELATIQTVINVRPHSNADKLVLVDILGWQVCERPNVVKPGDLVVYFEIDSMIPANVAWLPEPVKNRVKPGEDYCRVRTIKLRGEISQGLIVKVTDQLPIDNPVESQNVTAQLGIKKYKPSRLRVPGGPNQRKESDCEKFPTELLPKTEEYRIQSRPQYLKLMAEKPWYASLKYDGTSATYLMYNNDFKVCSRNYVRERPINVNDCIYWLIANEYDLETKLAGKNVAVQGEICGPTIQKNHLGLRYPQLYVFTVTDLDTKKRYTLDQMLEFCSSTGLSPVMIVDHGTTFQFKSIPKLLKKSEGKYPGTKNEREGLVYRTMDQSLSFKVINNKFLLKHE